MKNFTRKREKHIESLLFKIYFKLPQTIAVSKFLEITR